MLLKSLLWQSPGILYAGALPVRATSFSFDNESDALAAAGAPDHGKYCVSLNGVWKFRYLEDPENLTDADLDADCTAWDDITVPCPWTVQGFDRPHYTNVKMPYPEMPPRVAAKNPAGIYRTVFTIPESWNGRRIMVRFDGVESCYTLRVNNRDVGMAKDSRGSYEFDITEFCRPGENELTVLVVKWSDANFIEDQDMWWHGGIVRDVLLLSRPTDYIADVFANASLNEDFSAGILRVQGAVQFGAPGVDVKNWHLRVRLYDRSGKAVKGFPQDCPAGGYRFDGEVSSAIMPDECIECTLPGIKPWSAEDPCLYKLSVALVDPEGREVDYNSFRIGFRRMEIGKRKLWINGEAVRINGVNRHDSNPRTGRTVSREDMIKDLTLMKQFNINAIRTSHYPNSPEFYDLCDEFGFYVWSEANIETHAFYRTLSRNPLFAPAYTERVTQLVERDKNHPSIIVWSLGNESGFGANHAAMAGYIRFRDSSRPINYEGAVYKYLYSTEPERNQFLSDIVGPMYPPVSMIREWSRIAVNDPRPYIMVEYSHAMGNSNGELKDYFKAFDECEGLQGGFIWEWCDHAIYKKGDDGKEFLAYGGEFGDTPNDGNFVCDGLVGAERDVHPGLYEFKYFAQPIRFTAVDPALGIIELENRQYFSDFSKFVLCCEFQVDGKVVHRSRMPMPQVEARFSSKVLIRVDYPDWQKFSGKTVHLTLRALLKRDTWYAASGFEVAHEQFLLPVRLKEKPVIRKKFPVSVCEKNNCFEISTGKIALSVRCDTGESVWMNEDGSSLQGPEPWFYRAPTDNDGHRLPQLSKYGKPVEKWEAMGYDRMVSRVLEMSAGENSVRVVREITAPGVEGQAIIHKMQITAQSDGSVKVENRFSVPSGFDDLPRVGIVWKVPMSFDTAEYFGLGPFENYRDRDAAAVMGNYTVPFKELPGNYMMPQSSGNRTQVRELVLHGECTGSWRITADSMPFEFSILPFDDRELWAAYHWHELGEPKCWYWHLDAFQRGVGSRSCGPELHPRYRVCAGEYELDFTVSR